MKGGDKLRMSLAKIDESQIKIKDLKKLKEAISGIRSKISDFYADKYTNECNIQ